MYDHGIANDKHNFLDASLRVPLIMRLPGVISPGIVREFATTLDITATILAAAGAEKPRDYAGFDLLTPISRGEPSPRTVGISSEYRAMALVTHSYKLAYFPEEGEGRFWYRINDPSEQNDCASSRSQRRVWSSSKQAVLVSPFCLF
jgi:arylsulfatase A-like enzyme